MIYAMFTVMILTVLVGLIAVKARIAAVKDGQITASYFKLMQNQTVPEVITKTTRCFNNLFEIPVLFYIVCTLYLILALESDLAIIIAWLFVMFRAGQVYIHLTYNHVKHRMFMFGGSVLCVLLLWVNLVVLKF